MKNLFLFILPFFALLVFTDESLGQDILTDKRITLHINHAPFGKIAEQLIETYDVPIGYEQSTNPIDFYDYMFEPDIRFKLITKDYEESMGELITHPQQHWISLNLEDAPLPTAMDQIVNQMPGYKWEINDDVINIFPVKDRNPQFESLLRIKIDKFNIDKPLTIEALQQRLFMAPEAVSFVKSNNVCWQQNYSESMFNLRLLPNKFEFSDITFRSLLNEITKEKRGGWILREIRSSRNDRPPCINIQI